MKIEFELHGLDGALATLHSLPPEIVSRRGGPVKSALRKAAVLILKAEQSALRAVMGHQVDGAQRASTGLLLKSMIATRGKPPIGSKGERYLVRVKRGVFYKTNDSGNERRGSSITTAAKNAARLEYGTARQPAEPFIRPAAAANAEKALRTMETELVKGIDRVVKKLAAQNQGR